MKLLNSVNITLYTLTFHGIIIAQKKRKKLQMLCWTGLQTELHSCPNASVLVLQYNWVNKKTGSSAQSVSTSLLPVMETWWYMLLYLYYFSTKRYSNWFVWCFFQWLSDRKRRALQNKDVGKFKIIWTLERNRPIVNYMWQFLEYWCNRMSLHVNVKFKYI